MIKIVTHFIFIIFLILFSSAARSQTIPADHPRIFLNDSIRVHLTSALNTDQYFAVRFRDMVDNQLGGGDVYAFQGWYAALLYQLTGNISYGNYAVNFVENMVVSEEALINTGQRAQVAFDSYLYVSDYIGDLALVYDWCHDLLSEDQKTRWRAYANQAVWNVWHPDSARWGEVLYTWSGWSIDNPMNNYYYSFLHATMLLGLAEYGDDPQGITWVTMFRETKMGSQLFPAFTSKLAGGGSREGTGYGVSHSGLFNIYNLWQQTTGERICDSTVHARESLLYYLNMVVPTMDWVAPIGDHARESTGALFDYHREYVEALSFLYSKDPLAGRGKWFLGHCSVPEMTHGFEYVYDFIYDISQVHEEPLSGLDLMYYAQGVGHIFTRSSWETNATWINLIAGIYDESHAHRDQGSLMIFKNEWLADDQNRRTNSGIRQEERLHNLVRIDDQSGNTAEMAYDESSEVVALKDMPEYTYAAANITPMYSGASFVSRSEREMVFIRPSTIVLFDRVEGASSSSRVWQLNSPLVPVINGSSATFTGVQSTLSVTRILPSAAPLSAMDWNAIGDADMNSGYRLDITDSGGNGTSRFLNVLSIDGTVASVLSDNNGSRRGVNIDFTGGGSASLHFENDTWGGDILIRDSGGNILVNTALTTGVNSVMNMNKEIPGGFVLQQNYPNPFNPSTTIKFSISDLMMVDLKIYDLLGREIRTLVGGIQSAGEHTVEWNGMNSAGQKVGSGVYFYQLYVVPSAQRDRVPTESRNGRTESGVVITKKMMLLN